MMQSYASAAKLRAVGPFSPSASQHVRLRVHTTSDRQSTQRQGCNEWFLNTLYRRLNDKRKDAIAIHMQRLHEDDLVGHVLGLEPWEVLSIPAIAEADEEHRIETIWGPQCFTRRLGEALHPAREPLAVLQNIRRTTGEYNFAGQYQQAPPRWAAV